MSCNHVFRYHYTDSEARYIYDGAEVIAEYNQNDVLVCRYIMGRGVDEPMRMERLIGANWHTYYYHTNALGSIGALTEWHAGEEEETIVERYTYDAYGRLTVQTPGADGTFGTGDDDFLAASSVGNPYGFTARALDNETGLMYYRVRYYSTVQGRFLGRDPLGYILPVADSRLRRHAQRGLRAVPRPYDRLWSARPKRTASVLLRNRDYVDRMNLYAAYFVPNSVDPTGCDDSSTGGVTLDNGVTPGWEEIGEEWDAGGDHAHYCKGTSNQYEDVHIHAIIRNTSPDGTVHIGRKTGFVRSLTPTEEMHYWMVMFGW